MSKVQLPFHEIIAAYAATLANYNPEMLVTISFYGHKYETTVGAIQELARAGHAATHYRR